MKKEDIRQALRDADKFQKMYRKYAKALAIALLVLCALLALQTKDLFSALFIIAAYAGFLVQEIRSSRKYQTATEELNALLEEFAESTSEIPFDRLLYLSPQTQAFLNQDKEVYEDRRATLFASVGLGFIALVVLITGASIVVVSGYGGILDVPALVVGVFLLFMDAMVAIETIKWIARIPKSKTRP